MCKVDVEGCADVSEGEYVVLYQESGERSVFEGINKIVALNDVFGGGIGDLMMNWEVSFSF